MPLDHGLRPIVQSSINAFFGRPVQVEERVHQTLEALLTVRDDQTYALLWAIISRVPALASVLVNQGVDLTLLWRPAHGRVVADPYEHVRSVLSQALLNNYFDRTSLNASARAAQESGMLRVEDLITGTLRSPYNWPDRVPQTLLSSILTAQGRDFRRLGRTEIEVFAQELCDRFTQQAFFDLSLGDQQFGLMWDGQGHQLRPFATLTVVEQPSSAPTIQSGFGSEPTRFSVVDSESRFSSSSLSTLARLIDTAAKEQEFQDFFEQHPEFLLSLGEYSTAYPQVVLSHPTGGNLVPDFFLERLTSEYCDICELKRPTSEFVRYQKNRIRFRDAIMEAAAQLREYREWFEVEDRRNVFLREHGLRVFRPQAVLVIGRRQSFRDEVDRIRLEADLPRWLVLKTYDDVLATARQWRRLSGIERKP